jgi:hypothetical protein
MNFVKVEDRVERIAPLDPFHGPIGEVPVGARGTVTEIEDGDVTVMWDGGIGTRYYSLHRAPDYFRKLPT